MPPRECRLYFLTRERVPDGRKGPSRWKSGFPVLWHKSGGSRGRPAGVCRGLGRESPFARGLSQVGQPAQTPPGPFLLSAGLPGSPAQSSAGGWSGRRYAATAGQVADSRRDPALPLPLHVGTEGGVPAVRDGGRAALHRIRFNPRKGQDPGGPKCQRAVMAPHWILIASSAVSSPAPVILLGGGLYIFEDYLVPKAV